MNGKIPVFIINKALCYTNRESEMIEYLTKTNTMNEILKTKNYDLFEEFSSNREIDQKHLNRLIETIKSKNLLSINPIIVDSEMRVIDGQHRLEAAKILNLDIYYVLGDNINRHDIFRLNSNQKNWKTMDYINFYTVEKVKAYLELSKFINHYPHFSTSASISLCCGGKRSTVDIKAGTIQISDIESAYSIAEIIKEMYQKYQLDFIYDSRFPMALSAAFDDKNFNIETFYHKIDENPRAFVKCTKIQDSKAMIMEIYNRSLSKNKIQI